MTATVIIPTTGSPELKECIESVLKQTYNTKIYLVVDGIEYEDRVDNILDSFDFERDLSSIHFCTLPENVGAGGFYGHRVYASFTHLVNTKYVLYLDQDCYLEPHHVETLVNRIEVDNLDWAYSLRNICDQDGVYICHDDCESLGKWQTYHGMNHIDTNSYCLKTSIAIKLGLGRLLMLIRATLIAKELTNRSIPLASSKGHFLSS